MFCSPRLKAQPEYSRRASSNRFSARLENDVAGLGLQNHEAKVS